MTEASIVAEPRPRFAPRPGWLVASAAGGAILLFVLQAFAASRLELTFDEAYYALWSRSLAPGYLDHPPMVALFVRASTTLFGCSDLGIRALSLALVGALPALVALIAWRLFDSVETAALAVLMWMAAPLVIAGAVFATPDAPLVLFWTLGLAALVELWRTGKARWMIAMGLALGLMLLSKFTAAFFAAGAGLAFLTTPSLRRWLRSPVAVAGARARARDLLAVRRVERGARLGDLPEAGGTGGGGGFLAVLSRRVRRRPDPASEPARVRRRRGRRRGSRLAEGRRARIARRGPAPARKHDRAGGGLLPAACAARPGAGQLARAAVSRLRRARRRLGRPRPPRARRRSGAVLARAALWAAPLALAVMLVGFVQALTGVLPLGAADPTARLEGFRDLARDVDARAQGRRRVLPPDPGLRARPPS